MSRARDDKAEFVRVMGLEGRALLKLGHRRTWRFTRARKFAATSTGVVHIDGPELAAWRQEAWFEARYGATLAIRDHAEMVYAEMVYAEMGG